MTRSLDTRKCLSRKRNLDLSRVQVTQRERHFTGEASDVVVGVSVSADGTGVMAHAGSIAVRLLAERSGLTKELSKATAWRSFLPVHDRAGSRSTSRCWPMVVRRSRTSTRCATRGRCWGRWPRRRRLARPGRVDSRAVEARRGGPGQGPPTRVAPAATAAGLPDR